MTAVYFVQKCASYDRCLALRGNATRVGISISVPISVIVVVYFQGLYYIYMRYTYISLVMAERDLYNFGKILSEDEEKSRFCEWFWKEKNGNKLIDALNANNSPSAGSKIRRRNKWWPHIYCIVLNDDTNPGRSRPGEENPVQWKYCKVGITEKDTTTNTDNRMETVMNKIRNKIPDSKSSPIFVLAVKATDSRENREIEQGVRQHIGLKVNRDLAKANNLPVPTEWVLTTQPYIELVKQCIRKAVESNLEIDTSVFLGMGKFQQKTMLPLNLQIQGDEVVRES